jgi:hypothetical protein
MARKYQSTIASNGKIILFAREGMQQQKIFPFS